MGLLGLPQCGVNGAGQLGNVVGIRVLATYVQDSRLVRPGGTRRRILGPRTRYPVIGNGQAIELVGCHGYTHIHLRPPGRYPPARRHSPDAPRGAFRAQFPDKNDTARSAWPSCDTHRLHAYRSAARNPWPRLEWHHGQLVRDSYRTSVCMVVSRSVVAITYKT